MEYIKDPMAIEQKSFEIIESEWGQRDYDHHTDMLMKRLVHTTADFEYPDLVHMTEGCMKAALLAMKDGCKIYADTQMIMAGVNRVMLKKLGIEIVNYVHDEDVYEEAARRGITRSMVAMEKAVKDEDIKIYAIGNAPTALYRLLEHIQASDRIPSMIIGSPIGFVGAAESKEALLATGYPQITIKGRKGGSTVVSAIINALMYLTDEEYFDGTLRYQGK